MLDGVVSLLTYHASMHLTTATMSQRVGNRHATIAPYDTFSAADGELFLAVGNDDQFRRFCEVTGQQALLVDERFATNPARVVHHRELRERLVPILQRASARTLERCPDVAPVSRAERCVTCPTRCRIHSSWRAT